MKTAVIYLRVSTAAQADTDPDDADGYSIQAQRDACRRKAASLNLEVVDEYVDRGESAKKADRPALQRMLARIHDQRDIAYVIVHKVDRLARNRADDVAIALAFKAAGAQLVSATENIDDTPSGILLHGIMASIAEFYSQNLANEVLKGMVQKAQKGGTPNAAPIGYLNVRKTIDGVEVRDIAPDPERAPLIRYAFETYATANITLRGLLEDLTDMGLTCRPGPKRPAKPLSLAHLARTLHNSYYIGIVSYRGVEYPGRHEPLISQATFDRVQELLVAKNKAGEKQRLNPHYLKGSVFCKRCASRLCLINAKGNGGTYTYFFCLGRQRRNGCDLPYLSVDEVEAQVCAYYRTDVQLAPVLVEKLRRNLLAELEENRKQAAAEIRRLNLQIAKLDRERLRWAEKVIAGSVPDDIARDKQTQLARQLVRLRSELADLQTAAEDITETLHQALDLVRDCATAYTDAATDLRRQWNQTLFERIEIDADELTVVYREPFATLLDDGFIAHYQRRPDVTATTNGKTALCKTKNADKILVGVGSSKGYLVDLRGRFLNPNARAAVARLAGGPWAANQMAASDDSGMPHELRR